MIRLAWERLKHRKKTTLIILMAFISIYTLVPLGLEQSKTTVATVNDSIKKYGRGSYDLLVRPPSSRTSIEKKLGMVEENYIGDSKGGISINEWKRIKGDPNIEVAAPVASLGYFRGKQTSVELPVLSQPTRFSYQFYTSDGKSMYPLGSKESIMYFEQSNPGTIQFLRNNVGEATASSAMMILMPTNYNLLVAIDPESETKLTGIDFSDFNKKIEDPFLDSFLENYNNPPVMKVLQRNDFNIPIYLKLKVDQLDVKLNKYLDILGLKNQQWLMESSAEKIQLAFKDLEKEKPKESKIFNINLSNFQKPFDGTELALNNKFEPSIGERTLVGLDTSTYFVASKIDYKNIETIPAVTIKKPGNPPSYKTVVSKGVSMEKSQEIPFIISQVGTFTPPTNIANNLAASPLGIYGEVKAKTEDGKVLTPTTIPGSFIPSAASGVTTIENAKLIKGDKPIDAIRVKIAGITNYDEVAQKKIEKVATKLLQMGYEVDIVAGSSFKEMTLDVEGIGKVKEPWTTLGVAQELTATWNLMNLITTVLLTAFGVFWLVIRLTFEKNILIQENSLLSVLGWKKRNIFLRNCIEQDIIITIAFMMSIILLNFLHVEAIMYGITLFLWIISIVITNLLLNKTEKQNNRIEEYKKFASVLYYKRLIIPMMLLLCFSMLLISIQIAALGDSFNKSSVTTMGLFIGNQTYWFELTVTILVLYLCIIAFSEGLNTLFVERRQELNMYHVIGWTKGRILRHLFKESATWFVFSSIIGILFSTVVLKILSVSILWSLIGIGISFVVMSLIFSIILFTRKMSNLT
ncbi:ABC transporter permease [Neobacillus sp. OS1-32]|jgi:putative ABC transport system permease protein|uniref:ABC transporter permease n=1 Tax=Neobacillus paridis TaxID=2803862 RepID=A0ABS1TLF5_9BACI|nr:MULTISPECIES: ABC transporter permease [Neobacillus]MBL4951388.1 ABC transporter permease [Neobacillus paridis]WML30694.1 ABC transporter permease [Neobacillus sp. OS1-32]